jgi:hypothetical protein
MEADRSQKKLERLAREAGGRACAATPAEAVGGADAVLLARALEPDRRCPGAGWIAVTKNGTYVLAADDQERQPDGSRPHNVWRGKLGDGEGGVGTYVPRLRLFLNVLTGEMWAKTRG